MIEREQVLHVARLSRLKLDDDEVSRLETELSSILDHVDRLAEIDIEGVEPTSHVVPLENVLRDDVARPSLDRDVALGQAPDPVDGAFRVPSPQAEG
ncbi:MAG: Asp-tRNA(Asn)/Glu-tRNA(Gln) amidotransferase subunit GatC [Thermoleophilia bacterium]|nr:Asp-tRNA(Asn)/Glu-tRNA(Gln) amidotransferase subunit GatC [Thermoleophilia bacterium]